MTWGASVRDDFKPSEMARFCLSLTVKIWVAAFGVRFEMSVCSFFLALELSRY